MLWNEIVSAVCICISSVIFSASLQFSKKRTILFVQVFASIFYIASYFFALVSNSSATTGVIIAILETFRLAVFYSFDKHQKINTPAYRYSAGVLFCALATSLTLIFWEGYLGLLPLIGSILVSIGMSGKNIYNLKIAFLIQAILIVSYLACLHLWINMVTQVIVFNASVIGMFNLVKEDRKQYGKVNFLKQDGENLQKATENTEKIQNLEEK